MLAFSRVLRFTLIFTSLALIITLLISPQNMYNGISRGLVICSNIIIPSIFPFCVFSLFIFNCINFSNKKIPILRIDSGVFMIIIMSMLGGYPTGAKLITEAYKSNSISKSSANTLLLFCVNASPSFIVTAIGFSVFSNLKIGLILLVSHILATTEMLLFYKNGLKYEKGISKKAYNLSDAFVLSVANASNALINICAFVILFSGISEVIGSLPLSHTLKTLINCFFEVSSGILACKNIFITAFFLGFGGICVIFQIFSVTTLFLEKPIHFFVSRISHGILSSINLFLILKIFNVKIATISNSYQNSLAFNSKSFSFSVLLICFSLLLIGSILYKQYCGKISKDIL